MEVTLGEYTVVQSEYNNHVSVFRDGKVVEFMSYTHKATEDELLEIAASYNNTVQKGRVAPINKMSFTEALTEHIKGKPNAEIIASNDDTMVGVYQYKDENITRYILCNVSLRPNTGGSLPKNIGEVDAYKDKDAALKGYVDLCSDIRYSRRLIEDMRKRRNGNERSD